MTKQWYELEEKERIKQVYANYTIKDFWDFWSDKKQRTMEIRIKDYQLIRETATKFNLPWYKGGVFVRSAIELKNVIAFVRDKATIWFGAQPRKKNWNSKGWKVYDGLDTHIDEIAFIFIDIDRKEKDGPATLQDLKDCNKISDMIIERFSSEKWNKGFMKICSGNGVQLFVKLDIPIRLPRVEFKEAVEENGKFYYPVPNEEYDKIRQLITYGVGNEILKFSRAIKRKEEYEDLNIDIDKTSFRIGQVAALPFTKNIKHGGFRWRGIIDLQKGENDGLSDYILSKIDDVARATVKNIFSGGKVPHQKNMIREGGLMRHKLARFMLDNDFPDGMINNTLWFQLKILLRDSKYNINSAEFIKFHNMIKKRHGRSFTLNFPDKKFSFSEDIINAYCITHGFEPLYKLWPNRTKEKVMINKVFWHNKGSSVEPMILQKDTTILEDLKFAKSQMVENKNATNTNTAIAFLKGLIEKYNEDKAKRFLDLFDRFFNYE